MSELNVSAATECLETLPPHLIAGDVSEKQPYIVVIPSFNRPVLLRDRTFQLLQIQGIPLNQIYVFVASERAAGQTEDEQTRYTKELVPRGLVAENVIVGVKGIRQQRNYIIEWAHKKFGELMHVVSMDDDLEGLFYKVRTGFDSKGAEIGTLRALEAGGLGAWISHAAKGMSMYDCYAWSVNTSANPYFMRSNIIGTGNGMLNGYLYGFRVRANDPELLPQFKGATEDRERSVRYFAKDGIVLRYKMYCAVTKCFANLGGIQDEYSGTVEQRNQARKLEEREGHKMIESAFPELYSSESMQRRRMARTMEGSFRRLNSRNANVQHGLTPDLQPRKRGEGGAPARSVEHAPSAPTNEECSSTLCEGESAHSTSSGATKRKGRAAVDGAAKSSRAQQQEKCVAAYRSKHPPLKAAPDGWHIERGTWPSGQKYVRYRGNGRVCYSLTQIEAYLGRALLHESSDLYLSLSSQSLDHMQPSGLLLGASGVAPNSELDDGWRCELCTFHNEQSSTICVMCRCARTGYEAWRCDVCMAGNTELALACSACKTTRPDPDAWRCLHCRTFSPSEEDTCVDCKLSRSQNYEGGFQHYVDSDSDRDEPADIGDTSRASALCPAAVASRGEASASSSQCWRCVKCTFDNPASNDSCEMCGHDKEQKKRVRQNLSDDGVLIVEDSSDSETTCRSPFY